MPRELGHHRFDDKLTDYSVEARGRELARAKEARQKLAALTDLSHLTGPDSVDLRLLKDKIDYQIFSLEELKEWEWNSFIIKVSPIALFIGSARFAPADPRIHVCKRLQGILAVIA